MKPKASKHEQGQALVLITFAMIGLVGITGLAVDGGIAYTEKRDSQNAADAAAMAGALAKVRGGNISTTAQARATSNGFDNDGTINTVDNQ